ncbi:MAG: filamentous hemagglutinin N-terminal domain-containing protein [Cyanobacteria bacterium P01_C01_bin.72]
MNLKLLLFFASLISLFAPELVQAQIVEDGTLGTAVETKNNLDFKVDVGSQRGNNLFHSFSDFSIPENGSVLFNNPINVQNIISRVTGNNISTINGLIQSNGSANLFLINPNGIIFGENASLDIGGAFLGTTAQDLIFEDGGKFSTDLNASESLLTISTPVGLQFGRDPGVIENRANFQIPNPLDPTGQDQIKLGLTTSPGKTLALLGGEIIFDGGAVTAPAGNIELGSFAADSLVTLESISSGWGIADVNISQYQDIKLDNLASINTSGEMGGDINLLGKNIRLLNGSAITSDTLGNLDGGTIKIQATDSLEIIGSDPTGTKFDPLLAGVDIFLPFASQISSRTFGMGKGSNVEISAQNLNLTDGGTITLQTLNPLSINNPGESGSLEIAIADSIQLQGTRPLIRVGENVDNLLSPDFDLDTAIELNIPSEIQILSFSEADGGNISIKTQSIRLENGTTIASSSFNRGNSGNLDIEAEKSIEILGTTPRTGSVSSSITASTFDEGNAGKIDVTTEQLIIKDGGFLISTTATAGNSGSIEINATSVQISGSRQSDDTPSLISTQTNDGGNGGSIFLNADSLLISDGGGLSVEGLGSGVPGSLRVNAKNIEVRDFGSITATTEFETGGNVELNIQDNLTLRNNSTISAQAFNEASGGNLEIDTNFIIAFPQENNDILANAVFGNGGNININAEGILGIEEGSSQPPNLSNDIDASSEFGEGGIVSLEFPDSSSNNNLSQLSSDFVDVAYLFANTFCKIRGDNKFIATGRGGIPLVPDDTLLPEHTWSDWRIVAEGAEAEQVEEVEETKQTSETTAANSPKKLAMIQGWMTDPQGNVVLTDKPLNNIASQPALSHPNCNDLQK